MKKSKFYLISGVLGLVITTLVVSSLASASELNKQFKGKNFNPTRHEAMHESHESHEAMKIALASGDYNTWKELVDSRPKMSDIINQDNFDQFVQMHNYMQEGDFEVAKELQDELGLSGKRFHKGFHMGYKFGTERTKNLEE